MAMNKSHKGRLDYFCSRLWNKKNLSSLWDLVKIICLEGKSRLIHEASFKNYKDYPQLFSWQ